MQRVNELFNALATYIDYHEDEIFEDEGIVQIEASNESLRETHGKRN